VDLGVVDVVVHHVAKKPAPVDVVLKPAGSVSVAVAFARIRCVAVPRDTRPADRTASSHRQLGSFES